MYEKVFAAAERWIFLGAVGIVLFGMVALAGLSFAGRPDVLYEEYFANLLAALSAIVLLGWVYFLPTNIATKRRHGDLHAIAALNLLLGWSLIGWAAALLWALMRRRATN